LSLGEDVPAASSLVEKTHESTDGIALACLRSLNFNRAEFMVAILLCTFTSVLVYFWLLLSNILCVYTVEEKKICPHAIGSDC